MPILTLKVSKELFSNLEEAAASKGERTDEFVLKALQDSLNMWEDFSEMATDDENAFSDDTPCFQA